MTDDDDILAGELALGLLTKGEAAAAQARLRADPALEARVQWWLEHLTSFANDSAAPSPQLWQRIEARLAGNDNSRDLVRPWKWATAAASMAAVVLGGVALRPQPVVQVPLAVEAPAPLIASLSGKGAAVTVTYTSANRRLLITPVTLDAGEGDAELWIIPVGRTVPISMGVIDAAAPAVRGVDRTHAAMIAAGATFAISKEPKGGSPTGHATGPIMASGKIIRV